MLTSYHVHTHRSDGESSARAIVESAVKHGVDELGISDHFALSPYEDIDWCMPSSELPEYIAEISELKKEFEGKLIIRYGLEVDFFPESANDTAEVINSYPFDYIIGSVHFVNSFPVDNCKEEWEVITQKERDNIIINYWDRIRRMAESGLYDFAGHLDLYKKFGYLPRVDVTDLIDAALDAIAESNMPVEINTAGWFKDIKEEYPSEDILNKCYERNIPILITADVHNPEHIIRGYDKAALIARNIGYTKQAVFSGHKMQLLPLI